MPAVSAVFTAAADILLPTPLVASTAEVFRPAVFTAAAGILLPTPLVTSTAEVFPPAALTVEAFPLPASTVEVSPAEGFLAGKRAGSVLEDLEPEACRPVGSRPVHRAPRDSLVTVQDLSDCRLTVVSPGVGLLVPSAIIPCRGPAARRPRKEPL
ncbi:MAG: hypothetical protein ACLP9L_21090 [Thermoguttaceae bacterium]